MARKLTLETLIAKGACSGEVDKLRSIFGESAEVTVELCVQHAKDCNWKWAANRLLSVSAREVFDAERRIALDACDAAIIPASDAYFAATKKATNAYYAAIKPARDAYDYHTTLKKARDAYSEVLKQAQEAYDTATQQTNAAYDAVMKPAKNIYLAAIAKTFAELYIAAKPA